MIPKCIEDEVARLKKAGVNLDILEVNAQCYVRVRCLSASCPPWDRVKYDILIAIPVTYEHAGLDGFYLNEPHGFNGASHPRVNGQTITADGSSWKQVSWHYADGHEWKTGVDNLEGHISHCHGFFSGRGATNDYR